VPDLINPDDVSVHAKRGKKKGSSTASKPKKTAKRR
jgi:hypothetical protein